MRRVALVPGVLALLPDYASLTDPVAGLRRACLDAVTWLGADGGIEVLGSPAGVRVGRALAAAAGVDLLPGAADLLVVGNGSAKRTEKAPGYYDPRADGFDETLRSLLAAPDPAGLRAVDAELARELWADVAALPDLADALEGARLARVDYDDAPYGVQYWVMRWEA